MFSQWNEAGMQSSIIHSFLAMNQKLAEKQKHFNNLADKLSFSACLIQVLCMKAMMPISVANLCAFVLCQKIKLWQKCSSDMVGITN